MVANSMWAYRLLFKKIQLYVPVIERLQQQLPLQQRQQPPLLFSCSVCLVEQRVAAVLPVVAVLRAVTLEHLECLVIAQWTMAYQFLEYP